MPGSPSRLELWQAAFTTRHYKQLLGCITAATNWRVQEVPKKIDALYTHLNNIVHSGYAEVAAGYLEIPDRALPAPDMELMVCMAVLSSVKWKYGRVGSRWEASPSPSTDD